MGKFWKRKDKQPVSKAVIVPDMENNAVVLWSQRWLIDFIDAFLMRWCQFSLMIGCILGTFGLYATSFNLTAQPAFNGIWAGIQAVSIDGLFFAVWSVWRRSAGKGWLRAWYFFIGVLLMIVAAMVNGVVSYTELNRVETIKLTMQQLNINDTVFSWSRSVLVVLVAVLITTLPRGKQETVAQESVSQVDVEKVMQDMINHLQSVTVEMVERQIATIAVPQIPAPEIEETNLDESVSQAEFPGGEMEVIQFPESFQENRKPGNSSESAKRMRGILKRKPYITVSELATKANVSKGYASKVRTEFLKGRG